MDEAASGDGVRVLVVDDHPVFRDGLRAVLVSAAGFSLVGEASTGEEAIAATSRLAPDVVLMDLQMPEVNGIEATRRIVSGHPEVAVLVLTMSEDDESVAAALRAGARGYILKGSSRRDILRAIEAVAGGQVVFDADAAHRIIGQLTAGRASDPAFPQLTTRECDVLELVAQGQNNQVIARRLSLSAKTVRNHVSNILTKIHAADRAEAIVRAREAGLGRQG